MERQTGSETEREQKKKKYMSGHNKKHVRYDCKQNSNTSWYRLIGRQSQNDSNINCMRGYKKYYMYTKFQHKPGTDRQTESESERERERKKHNVYAQL